MRLLIIALFSIQVTRSLDPEKVSFLKNSHFLPTTAYSEYYYNPQPLTIEILDDLDWRSISRKYAGETLLQRFTQFLGLDLQPKGLGEISYALSDLSNHLERLVKPKDALSCKIANFDKLLIQIENIIKDHTKQDTTPKPLIRNKRGKRQRAKMVVNYSAWSYATSYAEIFEKNLVFDDLSEQQKKTYIISTALYFGQNNRRNMLVNIFKKANWYYSEGDSEETLRKRYRYHLAQKLGIDHFPGQIWEEWSKKGIKRNKNNDALIDHEIDQYNIANNRRTDDNIADRQMDNEDDTPTNIKDSFDKIPTIDSDEDMEDTLKTGSDFSGKDSEEVYIKIDHMKGPTDRRDDFMISNTGRNPKIIVGQVTEGTDLNKKKVEADPGSLPGKMPSNNILETGAVTPLDSEHENNLMSEGNEQLDTSLSKDNKDVTEPGSNNLVKTSDEINNQKTVSEDESNISISASEQGNDYDISNLNGKDEIQIDRQIDSNINNLESEYKEGNYLDTIEEKGIGVISNNNDFNQDLLDEVMDNFDMDSSQNIDLRDRAIDSFEKMDMTDDIIDNSDDIIDNSDDIIDNSDDIVDNSDDIVDSPGDIVDDSNILEGKVLTNNMLTDQNIDKPVLKLAGDKTISMGKQDKLENTNVIDNENENASNLAPTPKNVPIIGNTNNLNFESDTDSSSRTQTGTLEKKDQQIQTDPLKDLNLENANSIRTFNNQLNAFQTESKDAINEISLKLQGKEKLLIETCREKTCLESEKKDLEREKDRLTKELSDMTELKNNLQTLVNDEKKGREKEKAEKEGCQAKNRDLENKNKILQEGIDRRDDETKSKASTLEEKDRTIAMLSVSNQDLTDQIKLNENKLTFKQAEYERILSERSVLEGRIREKRETIKEKERDIQIKESEIKTLVGNIYNIRLEQNRLVEETKYTIDTIKAVQQFTERQDKETINNLKEENKQLRLSKRSGGEDKFTNMNPQNHDLTESVSLEQGSNMIVDEQTDNTFKELAERINMLPDKINQNIMDKIDDNFKTLSSKIKTNTITKKDIEDMIERRFPREVPWDGTIYFQKESEILVTNRAIRIEKIIKILQGNDVDLIEKLQTKIIHEILLVKSFVEYVVPTDGKPKIMNPLLFLSCDSVNTHDSPPAIVYQDEKIQMFKNKISGGFKYETMFFGDNPKYKLDKEPVFSPNFPPGKICEQATILGSSIFCTSDEINFSNLDCASDNKHSCNYIFDFRQNANRKLISGLKYECKEQCQILGQSGGFIANFIISVEIMKKSFKLPKIGDVWATILNFFAQYSWAILAWISFTGFNSFIIIYSCLTNFFFKNTTREFRWFPLTIKDLTNLCRCLTCRKQDTIPLQYELIPMRPNQARVVRNN